jgi:phosphoadenosine phosphosulfate reductase
MLPIFNEYIQFLYTKGVDIGLKEGYYWIESQIIKAYDKQGELHKIARLQIDDNLNTSLKTIYKVKEFEIESWTETIQRNIYRLQNLENNSLTLIANEVEKHNNKNLLILSSGGKDSAIITHLVRQLYPNTKIIFNNTSLDCADTYVYMKELTDVQITNPKEGFYQWIYKNIIPTRFGRGCCRVFKEEAIFDVLDKNEKFLFFMGLRNDESATRANYGDETFNPRWGQRDWISVLPIRTWNDEDVWLYILWRDLKINGKYKKGYHRVGCAIACPFYTKSTWILDKYWYPKMYERWHKILHEDFINNHKALVMNCTLKEYHINWNGGIVRSEPTDEVIQEFANMNNLDVEVAKKYFSHTCEECGKKIKHKEVIL